MRGSQLIDCGERPWCRKCTLGGYCSGLQRMRKHFHRLATVCRVDDCSRQQSAFYPCLTSFCNPVTSDIGKAEPAVAASFLPQFLECFFCADCHRIILCGDDVNLGLQGSRKL